MVNAAPTTAPGAGSAVPGGEYEKTLNELNGLVRANSLRKENVKEARELARKLNGIPAEQDRGGTIRVLSRLLKGLSGNDVPEKPSGPFNPGTKYPTDNYKSDFVFLNSNKASKSVLATLSSRHLRACYAFETSDEQLNWTKIQSEQRIQYSFLSASPSGDFALAGQWSDPNKLIKIDINKFYDYYFAKPGQTDGFESVVTGVEFGAVPLPIGNKGELYAVLTSGEMVPGVEIRRFDTGKPVFKLLLGRVANELRQGHFVSRMSFDARSKTCTVALKGSESLLLFSLDGGATTKEPDKPPELTPEIIQPSGTVIDWEYSFEGDELNIATVGERDSKVWRYDVKNTEKPRNSNSPLIGRAGASISAVASSRSGMYLAVGYEDGVVMIHDLRHGNREVLRLGHEGPVLKLGFSPDRRVLAVLVQHGKENIRAGFIRLWVTENWERDDDK
jgi:WD40 repeat protein